MSELRAIRVTNLRSIKDSGWVQLKPLTLLVGANSSGKSTLLRLFPLLKQSVLQQTQGPMLWFDENFVDFGGFNEALNSRAKEKVIELGFRLALPRDGRWPMWGRRSLPPDAGDVPSAVDLDVTIGLGTREGTLGSAEYKHVQIKGPWGSARVEFDQGTKVRSLTLDGVEIEVGFVGAWPVVGQLVPYVPSRFAQWRIGERPEVKDRVAAALKPIAHGNTTMARLVEEAANLTIDSREGLRQQLKQSRLGGLNRGVANDSMIDPLHQALVGRDLWFYLEEINAIVTNMARQVAYVRPFRQDPSRSYRVQDLNVASVDPTGANLAMFLRSLTEAERVAFDQWTQERFGFTVLAKTQEETTKLFIKRGEEERNLIDMGYGFSQVLPVIAQLWAPMRGRSSTRAARSRWPSESAAVICVEQPELHLHPGMQRQLARAIGGCAAQRLGTEKPDLRVPMLIETHSQSVLVEIGRMIEEKALQTEDVQVLFFEKGDNADTVVRPFSYDEEGVLPEAWPFGFLEP
jgi:energy-coupling factor transporter ATP-binding protein EcfA2